MGFEKEQRPFLGESYPVSPAEIRTQAVFSDGKAIFRQVVSLTGGNGSLAATVASLAGVIEQLVRADLTVVEAGVSELNRGTEAGFEANQTTGAITATHAGQDYTGDNPLATIEYTKQ